MIHAFFLLLMLSALELVLGVDNIIFISLVISKLPESSRMAVRFIAYSFALILRIALLWGVVVLSGVTTALFEISGFSVSVSDLLHCTGGVFLVWNTVMELQRQLLRNSSFGTDSSRRKHNVSNQNYYNAILQVVLIDLLLSFDSIFTAIGLTHNLVIMALAVVCGMICMFWLSGKISEYINLHKSIRTLALLFIMLVGVSLLFDSFHESLPHNLMFFTFGILLIAALLKMLLSKKN